MIDTILVANRGEIARRVLRACRDLGIGTVAVYSDPDTGAPHTAEADAAVRLPGAAPADTYLRGDLVIAAARTAGADAIHPGYGFLSENAAFARAVLDAGLVWIGPPPDAIAAMGSKIEAKRLMAAAGVPVLPELDPDAVTDDDLPLLVKASAGGGGRGIRTVRRLADLPGEIAAARREAESAFGDPAVFCEPLLENARHIEVQLLTDTHGGGWALGERECSVQRRHQKIVEEAPSPAVGPRLRERLCRAALDAARALSYVGAGTVEFMLTDDGRFHFLEVNTRLQVEHPVTECVYGVDLVRHQIEIAEGARLPADPPEPDGHAIEARLYAEDPAADWRPGTGTLDTFHVPGVDAEFARPARHGLRLDSGVTAGTRVGVHYDPMLAKLIAWAPTRAAAARRLRTALTRARIHGVTTNRDLLARLLGEPGFLAGDTDTGYLDRIGLDVLARPLAGPGAVRLSALAAALADAAARRAAAPVLGGLPTGWRNVPSQPQRRTYRTGGEEIRVAYRVTRDGLSLADPEPGAAPDDATRGRGIADDPGDDPADKTAGGSARGLASALAADDVVRGDADHANGAGRVVALVSAAPDAVTLEVGGVRRVFAGAAADGGDGVRRIDVDSPLGPVTLTEVPRFGDPAGRVAPGSLPAPMPGTVVRVEVEEGDAVEEGRTVVVLEAMKMEHRIAAPAAGVVAELPVRAGRRVEAGAVLAVIEAPGGETP